MGSELFTGRVIPWWAAVLLLVGGPISGKYLLLCWLLIVA